MKTPKEIGFDEDHHFNLLKLTLWLNDRKDDLNFDIRDWRSRKNASPFDVERGDDCGSAGCIIGWAPAAVGGSHILDSWEDFTRRVFGISHYSRTFDFLFDGKHFNSIEAGVMRLSWFLEFGIPENEFICGRRPTDKSLRLCEVKSIYLNESERSKSQSAPVWQHFLERDLPKLILDPEDKWNPDIEAMRQMVIYYKGRLS